MCVKLICKFSDSLIFLTLMHVVTLDTSNVAELTLHMMLSIRTFLHKRPRADLIHGP